jgi:hypothetical protein
MYQRLIKRFPKSKYRAKAVSRMKKQVTGKATSKKTVLEKKKEFVDEKKRSFRGQRNRHGLGSPILVQPVLHPDCDRCES